MKGILLYFSGTGNTKFIANKIKEEFQKNGCEIESYSIEDKIDLKSLSFDYLILGFPKYFEYIPKIFMEYLEENLFLSNEEIKTMIFSTGKDKIKSDFNVLEKKLFKKNYKVTVTKNFQMPNSFTLSRGYKKNEQISNNSLDEIRECVVNFLTDNYMNEESNKFISLVYKIINKFKTKDLFKNSVKFSVNSSCDKCSLCVKTCPTKNIENLGGNIKFRDNCILCCRCANICPKNAILYNEKEHCQYKENMDLIFNELEYEDLIL